MLNKIIVQGRLCADPELRRTQSGKAVASVTLAVDRDFKSQNGDKETDFIPVVAWGGTGEVLAKYFPKGRMAVVEGRLQVRKWQADDGSNRYTTEIVANSIYFCDSKREDAAPAMATPTAVKFEEYDSDEQLPF